MTDGVESAPRARIRALLLLSALAAVAAVRAWPTLTAVCVATVAVVVLAATIAGPLRRGVPAWGGWTLLGAGGVVALAGTMLATEGDVGSADVERAAGVQLAGYALAAAGLLAVGRRKRVDRDNQGAIDTTIVVVGAIGLTYQLFYGLSSHDASAAPATTIPTSFAFVLAAAAIVMAGAVARLVFATARQLRSGELLAAGSVCAAGGAMLYGLVSGPAPSVARQGPLIVSAAGWALVAAGLADASLRQLGSPTVRPTAVLSSARIMLLALAQLAPGIGVAINTQLNRPVDVSGLVLSSGLAGLLVLGRVVTLVTDVERARQATRRRDRWYRQLVRHSADVLFIVDRSQRLQFVSPAIHQALGLLPGEVLGRPLTEIVHPDDEAALNAAMAERRSNPHTDVGLVQVRLLGADRAPRWVELSLSDRLDDPNVAGVVVNARDITVKKQQEAEIAFAYDKQAAIAALGRAALAGTDSAGLAELAVSQIELTLRVDAAELYRMATDGTTLDLEAARGPWAHAVGELALAVERSSQAGYAMSIGEAVLSEDLRLEGRFETRSERARGMASSVSIVVRGQAQTYGVLAAASRRVHAFSDQDLAFLTTMANELALALERRSAEEETRRQALHDALTGLPNRVMFLNRLKAVAGRAAERKRYLGVLFLDLDHFKVVNDSLGHDAGDQLLVHVSRRLRDATRPSDTVARFGGDEFVVLCEDLESVAEAEGIAARVRASMDPPFDLGASDVHVSASIGIAVMGATSDPEALVRDADAAMYKAKERGRARYEVFDFTMREKAIARLRTETALHRALADRQLAVHYQPVVRLPDGWQIGAEALARWEHPHWGLLGPERFIPIAESSGLIDEVGRFVLGEACAAIARWQRDVGDRLELVSVNLSALQLNQPWLTSKLSDLLDHSGADPKRLCLEITESAVMSDVGRSMRMLEELREIGVSVAVDDFGTGYSSLAYLRKLPVDLLKVDREFVRGLASSAEDRAITHAVITLAHRLGLVAVAEGVEVHSQVNELVTLDCDLAQGYFFGEAVPAGQFGWAAASATAANP